MQASIAISGDGAFDPMPDYMDEVNKLQDKAGKKIAETMEQLKESMTTTE